MWLFLFIVAHEMLGIKKLITHACIVWRIRNDSRLYKSRNYTAWIWYTMGTRMCRTRTVLGCIAQVPDNLSLISISLLDVTPIVGRYVALCFANVVNKFASYVAMHEVILIGLNHGVTVTETNSNTFSNFHSFNRMRSNKDSQAIYIFVLIRSQPKQLRDYSGNKV